MASSQAIHCRHCAEDRHERKTGRWRHGVGKAQQVFYFKARHYILLIFTHAIISFKDYLQFQANQANAISGQISYALLSRTGENG